MDEVISVKGVCKKYPSFYLDHVSFSLKRGSITGFIGRNGAGKTTTIKSLLNLIHTDSGEIEYFGQPLFGNEMEVKQRIGYASGGVSYYPQKKLSAITSVTRTFFTNWDEAAYRHYMEVFKLDENKKVKELSEGMKVKYSLAVALSHKAEILILDEPTSGLDPVSRDELLTIFEKLKEKGITIFFSTHITSDLEKCADHIVYIKNGVILGADSKEQFEKDMGGGTFEDIMVRLEKEDIAL